MIERLKRRVRTILYLAYLVSRIDWIRFLRAHDQSANTVVWALQDATVRKFYRYLQDNVFLNDLAMLHALVDAGIKFQLRVGRNIGDLTGKRVFYTISRQFNLYGVSDHAAPMLEVVGALERQGNQMIPTHREASLWENKAHMHREFERLGIRCPKTWVVTDTSKGGLAGFAMERYPLLLKETHSASSSGLTKVNEHACLCRAIADRVARGQSDFLVQRLLDIRRDLRVILVEGEVVLFYWRINQGKEWRPTSTGHGSSVDFETFPEKWRSWITESFARLSITTGAFDIAWQRDDLESEPYILEVSPAYMPNPPLPGKYRDLTYSQYKKVLFPYPRYPFDYVDVVFAIKRNVVGAYIKKFLSE